MSGDAKKVSDAAGDYIDNTGKAITRQAQSTALAVSKGDFNSFQNTLIESSAMGLTGGASAGLGFKAGENNVDRLTTKTVSDAENTAAAQAVTDAAAEAKKTLDEKNSLLDSTAKSRKRTPGRTATMLTSNGNYTGGSLLSVKGK